MSELPSMPLFIDDYDAATAHLTLEEDGAYMRLLRLCWRQPDCSVPNDKAWIMRRMRCDEETYDRVIVPLIAEFFTCSNARIWQKRQQREHQYVRDVAERRREAGSRGGKAKSLKKNKNDDSKATILPEQNSSKTVAPTLTLTPNKDSEANASAADAAPTGPVLEGEIEICGEDPKAKLFRIGKTTLASFGVAERRTGALIGQWLKQRPDPVGLLAAIQFARDQNVAEPVAYISAVVNGKSNNGHQRRSGQSLAELARDMAEEARQREREACAGRAGELF